jgi:hypothetical protein
MKGMNAEQRKQYVNQKAGDRKKIQGEIQALNAKRKDYIETNTQPADQDKMLDGALIKAVKDRAKVKNLSFTK